MTAVRRLALWVVLSVLTMNGVRAQDLSFNPTTKFKIEWAWGGNYTVAPGSGHNVNSPLCVTASNNSADDCYWYLQEYKKGKFAIKNASTGVYITWDEVRSDSPIRRSLNLTDELHGDSSLWTVNRYSGSDTYYFTNAAEPEYYFNVRTTSYAVGTYQHSSNSVAYNEQFYIVKEDGSYYDASTDSNTVCGITSDSLYWASSSLSRPFVFTTDQSNPVYYYIRNVRSQMWVEPTQWLLQSATLPQKRFYFLDTDGGTQIMVEGGGYVSGTLTQTTETTAQDISVKSGAPAANDETWNIQYQNLSEYPGYSIGIDKCSANTGFNWHFFQSATYWNDYSNEGICWYSVDSGSTFLFYSKDSRHRDYLAGQGLVIPSDYVLPKDTVGPDNPVDPNPKDTSSLEPVSGSIVYVFRADGKIDAVPRMYIDTISQTRDSIIIRTNEGAPAYSYARFEVDSLSNTPPEFPKFNSFKFNDKFNRFLIEDAEGEIQGDSLITLTVKGIGKTLRPSFRLDDDVQAFIGDSLQQSKVTRVRFANDITYTVARRGQTILRRTTEGAYKLMPLGREVRVSVDFLTDHSTGEYNVPTIYLTTQNSQAITSKSYYLNGTVRIDGAGVFPDLPQTDMQIKGRGNSSWTTTGKAPYHLKLGTSTPILGLKKGKHWNLIANAQSRSATTNAVSMKMAQLVETAGFNHEIPVELYLNGEYRGSYNLTENIGFRNNSIDLDDETNAVMLELDSYYDDDYKFRTTYYYLPVNIKEPDLADSTTTLTLSEIRTHFNRAITALRNNEDMSQYLDLDYLARYLFVEDLSMNFEFMHPKSTFLYNPNIRDTDSRYIFGPVWDFDWGFGYQNRYTYFTVSPTIDYWTGASSMQAADWVNKLRYCSDSLNRDYYRLWTTFMNNGSLQELIDFCQDYYDYAAPSLDHNYTLWGGGNASAYATVTSNAKTWLKRRADYIYNYLGTTLGYEALGYGNDTSAGPLLGDVNGDGFVTTADLVCILNYILGLPNEDFDFDQADTDKNGIITVADLINVRNLIASAPAQSGRFYSLPPAEAELIANPVNYTSTGFTLPLTIRVEGGEYSGLQFDLKVPAGMSVDNMDISSAIPDFDLNVARLDNSAYADRTYDRYRISIYSGADHLLPIGNSSIPLHLSWGDMDRSTDVQTISLGDVMFATSAGEDERAASKSVTFLSGEPTGINSTVALLRQEGNKLTFRSNGNSVLPVYGADGRLYRIYRLSDGTEQISLPFGIYIINKQKIVVR